MTEIMNRRSLLALCLMACIAPLAGLAQDYKPLLGKWSMTSEANGDSLNWTLILKEADGKLSASLASEQGEMPVKEVSYSGGILKFKAPYEDNDYDVELTLVADKLEGTWSGNGDSGKTTGTKG